MADWCEHHRFVIVGAGFSGIAAAAKLKRAGERDLLILERAGRVGGTWRDNRYPGCACDVPSHLYSLSFAPYTGWSSHYAPQPEILGYLERVVDREGLAPSIRFNSELTAASFDEQSRRWLVSAGGRTYSATYLILAPGPLSDPKLPAIEGLDRFRGVLFHSARWNHRVPLTGKRVGVIGTGATAVQLIPKLQPLVRELRVFQRTPGWVLPIHNRPLPRWVRFLLGGCPPLRRALRGWIYLRQEALVGVLLRRGLGRPVERFALRQLERQVPDPALRAALTPSFPLGCKRILLSDAYYPALCKPNVSLVSDPIVRFEERGVLTRDQAGTERLHELDVVVLATGFRATEIPIATRIRGRGGTTLAEFWSGSPRAYLGATIPGFPSLFLLYGPNTNLGHNSVLVMVEAQLEHLLALLAETRKRGLDGFEVTPQAFTAYNKRVDRAFRGTVWERGSCASWYVDANGRNSSIWPGSTVGFRLRARRLDRRAYAIPPPSANGFARPASQTVVEQAH